MSHSRGVFVITGGSRGIGEAVARSAAKEGYVVLLTYVTQKGAADGVVERIRAQGGSAHAVQVDTSDVNLTGAMICAREAVRRMSTSHGGKGGSIVFISSRATIYGSPGEFVWYAASKGGVDSLTTGLAREVGSQGIRVNAVSPGPIRTDIHVPGKLERIEKGLPMQRAGEPEEVASAVMYLVSDAASYVSGANLAVAGAR